MSLLFSNPPLKVSCRSSYKAVNSFRVVYRTSSSSHKEENGSEEGSVANKWSNSVIINAIMILCVVDIPMVPKR